MSKLTITEALAELKTIKARLAKKREALLPFLARDNRVKDPLESEGGSREYIIRERQSIKDLEDRYVKIRTSINKVNLETTLAINGFSNSLAEWLVWRKDLSKENADFLNKLSNGIKGLRNEITRKGFKLTAEEKDAGPNDIVVHLNEKALLDEQDQVTKLLGDLDGKLSLLNATTTIEL